MLTLSKNILWTGGAATSVAVAGVLGYAVSTGRFEPAAAPQPSVATSGAEPLSENVPPPVRPQFDVVRVEPSGSAVIAGRAAPNTVVALLNKGEQIGEAKSDANGQFVILPPDLKPGDQLLSLRAGDAAHSIVSEQTVASVVPRQAGEHVLAALAQAKEPTKVLGDKRAASGSVSIKTVETGGDGAFMASGGAKPGASVNLYLNNSFVAPVEANSSGEWSLRVEHGMAPGHYEIRADAVKKGGGKVESRAEAPFDYTATNKAAADARPTAAPTTQTVADASTPDAAVVSDMRSVKVERGDSLWRISRKVFGEGIRYTQIYEANAAQIRDPDLIFPGQVFVAPQSRTE